LCLDSDDRHKPWTSREKIEAIKAAYQRERASQRKAVTLDDIPFSYELITTKWITATIGRHCSGAVATSFQLGPEDDGTSNRRHISIEWNDAGKAAGLPSSVFCKATQGLNNRLNLSFGGIDSEVNFFNNLRQLVDIEAPVSLHAALDPESFNSIIVLRDLSDKVTFCGSKTYVTQEMLYDQLQILAKLHGRFYMSDEQAAKEIVTFRQAFSGYHQTVAVEEACRDGWLAAKDVIPSRLYEQADKIWPATIRSYIRDSERPWTIAHGDVHLGNWYRTKDGRMGLQDYQCLVRSHWSRDLVYLLATSPTVQHRRAWEKDAVRFYLKELASEGGPQATEEEAWREMRFEIFSVLASWTLTFRPSADMPSNMQKPETSLIFLERLAAMMDDHDVLAVFDEV
jgi:hypothetical protein